MQSTIDEPLFLAGMRKTLKKHHWVDSNLGPMVYKFKMLTVIVKL